MLHLPPPAPPAPHPPLPYCPPPPLQERSQVAREIRLHTQLCHETIIAMYAAWEDASYVYMLLEWAAGVRGGVGVGGYRQRLGHMSQARCRQKEGLGVYCSPLSGWGVG